MPGQLDQPSSTAEQSLESPVKYTPSIQSPLEAFPALTKVEQPELKLQGNNIEVPPIAVKGWQIDRTTGNTNSPNFLELTNPYQSWTLDVAGRKWTDLGANQPAPDSTRPLTVEAAPAGTYADSPGNRAIGVRYQQYEPSNQQTRFSGRDISYRHDPLGPPIDHDFVRAANLIANDTTGRYRPQYSDNTSRNPFSILINAVEGIGKALWALTPFRNSVRGGRLGCAASVSEVLQKSGYQYANHAGVGGLESQLMRNGWTKAPLSEAAPEDVVMVGRSRGWRAGGGSAHVGIVGENGTVYHNSSSRGQWVKDNLQARFGRGGEMFVLKPPANGRHHIDPKLFVCNPEPSATLMPEQRSWAPGERQHQSDQGPRNRGYDTRYGDDNSGYRRQDRFQQRFDDQSFNRGPRYDQRDQATRFDPQFAGPTDEMPRRGRQRMGGDISDRRNWQQRMMDRLRRQLRY